MTIFKSHQVNLDPKPWRYTGPSGMRRAERDLPDEGTLYHYTYDPRPEFEPTRDPFPYVSALGARYAYPGTLGSERLVWAPRREQFDTPVNRVLVLFRRDAEHNGIKSALEYDWPTNSVASSPDEIEHARKVLTRLAGWLA